MGRLLQELAAHPRLPTPCETRDSCESQSPGESTTGRVSQHSQHSQPLAPTDEGRLLAALRARNYPDALLGRDDATPGQIAQLTAAELDGYSIGLHNSAEREAGRQPQGWSVASVCAACGPVWLWESAGARVLACPWCHSRRARKPIPRPLVRCGDCQHYTRDPINPEGGSGTCSAGHTYSNPYPHVTRRCGDWRPRDGA
jgi:hypothetical protein